jgi:hypothetical protein
MRRVYVRPKWVWRQRPAAQRGRGLSQMQLRREVLDWHSYSNRRKIAGLAGVVPSEWSTGTSNGVAPLPKREVLRGSNPARKKEACPRTSQLGLVQGVSLFLSTNETYSCHGNQRSETGFASRAAEDSDD